MLPSLGSGITVPLSPARQVGSQSRNESTPCRDQVIDLGGGLVIPGAPTFGAIHADHGTLIAAEDHAVAVLGIDPELVVVVAAGRSFHRNKSLAGVGGHVSRGVYHVGAVGVGGIDGHGFEIPAAAPQPVLAVDQVPRGAGVIGDVDSAAGARARAASSATSADRKSTRLN